MLFDAPAAERSTASSPVASLSAFPPLRTPKKHSHALRLVDVSLRAAPIVPLSLPEQNRITGTYFDKRRRQSRAQAHAARLPPLVMDAAAAAAAPAVRFCNKWDCYVTAYTSRDALCDAYNDADADGLLYAVRRSAQRPSPWWHAALVEVNPVPLTSCPALWYPLLSTPTYGQPSLWARAAYASHYGHIVEPPRTRAGQALRAHMRCSDLLGSFHQELLEKVQLEVATAYRTDMALAMLFLIMEAFAGEVLPPVYIVEMAVEALRAALRASVGGGGDDLRLDALVPAEVFHEAAFAYMERWVETAFVAEWRDMLGQLLHVVTPALPVALRLVVEAFSPHCVPRHLHHQRSDAQALSSAPTWEWRLPFAPPPQSSSSSGRPCLQDRGSWWWVAYPPETCAALERLAVARANVEDERAAMEEHEAYAPHEAGSAAAADVVDADHFEEVVQWRGQWNGVVVRHEGMPLDIRRRNHRPEALRTALGQDSMHAVVPGPETTEGTAVCAHARHREEESDDPCQRLIALALRTYQPPPPPERTAAGQRSGAANTQHRDAGASLTDGVDWAQRSGDALAQVDCTHWTRRWMQHPLPPSIEAQRAVYDTLVRQGCVDVPNQPVAVSAYGPPFRAYRHTPSHDAAHNGHLHGTASPSDPRIDDGVQRYPRPGDGDDGAALVPEYVVSGMVAPHPPVNGDDDGDGDGGAEKGNPLRSLPKAAASELRWLKERALWKPQQDDVVLHYFDGYCTAKAVLSLTQLLRLLHDPAAHAHDAVVLFGQLQRRAVATSGQSGDDAANRPDCDDAALVATDDGHPNRNGRPFALEALNIQLLHERTPPGRRTTQHRRRSSLTNAAGGARQRRRGDLSNDANGEHSRRDDAPPGLPTATDGHDGADAAAVVHSATEEATDANAYTFDVFLAAPHGRLDRLLRTPLITTGGVGVLQRLIHTIRVYVSERDRATRAAVTQGAGHTDMFACSATDVAAGRHVRLVVQCASQDGWAQPIGSSRHGGPRDASHCGVGAPPVDPHMSMSAALMLELQRINPRCRVQLPLGGLRVRPHNCPSDGTTAGRPPASISFPDETPLAPLASVFHQRKPRARRSRSSFHFNAVQSPRASSPMRRSLPSSAALGSPTASVDATSALDFRCALSLGHNQRHHHQHTTNVALTLMSATKVFQPAAAPPPMGLGTLIHGRGSLVMCMGDASTHEATPLDALAAPSASLLRPTDGSLRLRRASVPAAEQSQSMFAQRKASSRSPPHRGTSTATNAPVAARSTSSMSYFMSSGSGTEGGESKAHLGNVWHPAKGRPNVVHHPARSGDPNGHRHNTDAALVASGSHATTSCSRGEDLRAGREAPWSTLPPLTTPTAVPPVPCVGTASSALPMMKPKKRF